MNGVRDDRARAGAAFSETQWRRIHTLLEELDDQQALWLSGYLAGQNTDTARLGQKPEDAPALLIAYGTETDNSRELAERFSEQCREAGVAAEVRIWPGCAPGSWLSASIWW